MDNELRKAERLLSSRGLVFSARWAAELLFAVATGGAESPHQPPPTSPPEKEEEDPRVLFARTLLATREYKRAAAALADAQGPAALFVRCYARFLALSQAQNARRPDLCASDTAAAACVTSAELRELAEIAEALRAAAESDALCGYLCGVALRAADRRSDARACLADSISRFPLNASAWAEFAACCDGFDEAARLLPRAHWSADFAIAKAASELQAPAAAREALCRLLQRFPRSLYVKRELAAALCAGREHAEAERLLLEVRAEDPLCLEGIDTLSNLLYLRDDHATLSALARDAARIDPTRAESLVAAGNYLSLVGRHEEAAKCFAQAAKVSACGSSAGSAALVLLGHEYLELKNVPASIRAYRAATEASPREYRAWYGLGLAYATLRQPLHAAFYAKRACTLRPYDPRMWCLLGQCADIAGDSRWAINSYARAAANDPRDMIAAAALARLLSADPSPIAQRAAAHFARIQRDAAAASAEGRANGKPEGVAPSVDVAPALVLLARYCAKQTPPLVVEAEECCTRLLEIGSGQEREIAKEILRTLSSSQP